MSALLTSLGIDRLSPAERLRLISEIWDSLPEQPPPDLTDEQGQELEPPAHPDGCRPNSLTPVGRGGSAGARRFSYGIFYRVRADRVEVIGIFHDRRSPRVWQRRSRGS